jgi:hypothetical protein
MLDAKKQKARKPNKMCGACEGIKNCPAKKEGTIKNRFFAQSLGLRSFM